MTFGKSVIVNLKDKKCIIKDGSIQALNKVNQNFSHMKIGEKSTFEASINYVIELHTAVSIAFSVSSSVESEMVNTALIYSLAADPTERGGAKG